MQMQRGLGETLADMWQRALAGWQQDGISDLINHFPL